MRRILFLSLVFLTSSSFASVSIGGISVATEQVQSNLKENSNFISTGDNIKNLETKRIELLSTLKLEKSDSDTVRQKNTLVKLINDIEKLLKEWSTLSIEKIQLSTRTDLTSEEAVQLKNITIELDTKQDAISKNIVSLSRLLDFGPFSSDTPFSDLQKEFPTMKLLADNAINGYEISIANADKKKADLLSQKQSELDALTREIERLKQVRHDQIIQSTKQIGGYILVFVAIYCAKIITLGMFKRFGRGFSKSHQEATRLVHRWVFNILFIGAFMVLFAAELLSFLPFVAILGTAVGLALRDVIYSFIGWFAVGSDSGYQEGDFIEFEGTQGRVYRITPLLTNIEEYGAQGFTGKIISFPNKTIFEKNVKNWSRGSDFSLMTLDFLLTHQSDIEKAKKLLLGVVGTDAKTLYEKSRRELVNFKATYKYTDEDLKPQVHIVSDPRGIILRVRVLVHVQDKLEEQSRIMEEFSTAVQREKDIAFRTV